MITNNPNFLNMPIIDLSYLQITFGDSQEMIKLVIDLFINQTPGQIREMKQEIIDNKPENVKRIAHKLKSSFLTIGAMEIANKLEYIEQKAGETEINEIASLADTIASDNLKVITELKNL